MLGLKLTMSFFPKPRNGSAIQSPFQTLLRTMGVDINLDEIKQQAEAIIAATQTQAKQFAEQLSRIEHKLDTLCEQQGIKVTYEHPSDTTNSGSDSPHTTHGAK